MEVPFKAILREICRKMPLQQPHTQHDVTLHRIIFFFTQHKRPYMIYIACPQSSRNANRGGSGSTDKNVYTSYSYR